MPRVKEDYKHVLSVNILGTFSFHRVCSLAKVPYVIVSFHGDSYKISINGQVTGTCNLSLNLIISVDFELMTICA